MKEVSAYYLEDREDVLAKAIEMVQKASTHVYGMGKDLSWLNDPRFRDAVKSRATLREGGDLDMLVIAANRDQSAKTYARVFYDEIQARVGFSDFGQVRVVVYDGKGLLLGFPIAPCLANEVSEVGFGLYVEHPRLATWLEQRFLSQYSKCPKLGHNCFVNFGAWLRNNKYHITFAVLLSVGSFILGLLARALGM